MFSSTLGRFAAVATLVAGSLTVATFSIAQPPAVPPPAPVMPPSLPPSHSVNLMTQDGIKAFGTQWKVADVKIVEVPAIPNAMPKYKTTYNIEPRAGELGFDDSKWEVIDAKDLAARRGGGHVSFMWYRATFTMPAKLGNFDLAKPSVAVLDVLVDDYAEVWINGQIPRRSGYPCSGHGAGPQHAQPRRARDRGQGGRQIRGRDLRHQRADLGRAGEHGLVPLRQDGFLPVSVAG